MSKWLLLVVAGGLAVSCSAAVPKPFLTVYGAAVKVVQQKDVAACQPVGAVHCEYVWSDVTVKNQEYVCRVDCQNQAAEMGGTHVVLLPPRIQPDVIMDGTAFRCSQ